MRGANFALVARDVFVEPDAERDAQAEFGGDLRHQLETAGRGIGADRIGVRRDRREILADLFGGRTLGRIVGIA